MRIMYWSADLCSSYLSPSPLMNREKSACPSPRAKSVVHSGHGVVTKLDGLEPPRSTGTWFHGQVLDSNERVPFGTFFTKSPIGAVFPFTSGRTRPRCTDLSTCAVDKGKPPGATVTCES